MERHKEAFNSGDKPIQSAYLHKEALRQLVDNIRRFRRYLHSNNVYNVLSITHDRDLSTIHIYSISPLIVNMCMRNLLYAMGLNHTPGSATTMGASRVVVDNMYGVKTRILSNHLYSIKINIVFMSALTSLAQITCKRLIGIGYNPELLPLEVIDQLAFYDPVISIRYLFDT